MSTGTKAGLLVAALGTLTTVCLAAQAGPSERQVVDEAAAGRGKSLYVLSSSLVLREPVVRVHWIQQSAPSRNHREVGRFSASTQFRTTVIGVGGLADSFTMNRKRWPSRVTS